MSAQWIFDFTDASPLIIGGNTEVIRAALVKFKTAVKNIRAHFDNLNDFNAALSERDVDGFPFFCHSVSPDVDPPELGEIKLEETFQKSINFINTSLIPNIRKLIARTLRKI